MTAHEPSNFYRRCQVKGRVTVELRRADLIALLQMAEEGLDVSDHYPHSFRPRIGRKRAERAIEQAGQALDYRKGEDTQ